MAINVKTITCPACGAKVNYDENSKVATCEFCGAVLDLSEWYGDKKDRERDDMQDEQIRTIMNNMHRRNVRTTQTDPEQIKKAKKTALIIIISIFGFIFLSTIITTIVGGTAAYRAISKTTEQKIIEKEINPFDNFSVSYTGVSGNGTARLNDINIYSISKVKKSISGPEKLSNGDVITVKYEETGAQHNSEKYIFTQLEKTFTVSGLDEYVSDITKVNAEDFEMLKKNAINKAAAECKEADIEYAEDSFDIYATYTMIKKEYTDQISVFVVSFEYTFEGETKTGYFMAKYDDAIRRADGEYKINFNAGLFTYAKESYWGGFTVTSAHSDWDAVYTDVYLNNKADWNIHEDYLKTE